MRGIKVKLISLLLVFSILFELVACSASPEAMPTTNRRNDDEINEDVLIEDVLNEDILSEDILDEFITEEIYLEEIVLAEDTITEMLLQEDEINEVLLCKVIYVPQSRIDEFSNNSQTKELFGEDIDLSKVMTEISVGTGIIVTLVVLKKANIPDPIASMVVAAASESMRFGATGAAIGSLYGGLAGAGEELDSSGRTNAVLGVAVATVGLIVSAISFATAVQTAGATGMTADLGVKIALSGIGMIIGAYEAPTSAIDCVRTFNATDAADIDWDNVDWEAMGESAAQESINYGADGFMWGTIIGAVSGGADGYDFYRKFNTPYSTYNARLMQTSNSGGHWEGERGESRFILDEPFELRDGTTVTGVNYQNCVPDFTPFAEGEVNISRMTNNRTNNFSQADQALAELWDRINYNGQSWTAADVNVYRMANGLTWHEMNNMETMQLVPTEVNGSFGHLGGVGEYNAMINQEGVGDFD